MRESSFITKEHELQKKRSMLAIKFLVAAARKLSFVQEHFGVMGEKAVSYLHCLSKRSFNDRGQCTLKVIARKCSLTSSISISEATSNLHELLSVRLLAIECKVV